MKRILLFLVFMFLCLNTIYSQQYKIEISGYIGRGDSDCGTINGLRGVYLLYSGGTRSANLHTGGSYYHNKSFSFSATIEHSKRPYAVRFETKERHRSWGDCVGGDGNKEVAISYPCKDTSYDNSEVFHSEINGNARIKIYPIVDVKHPDGTNISTTKTVCETSYAQVAATVTGHSSYATTYKWEFRDPVNTITRRTSAYQTLYDRYLDYYEDYTYCQDNNDDGGGGGIPILFKSNTKVKIEEEKSVEEEDANIAAIPPVIPIDGGGACDYWYTRYNTAWIAYRDYSGTKYYEDFLWRALNKNGQTTVNLRLTDFYSNENDRKEALNNKIIWVRLNPGCDNTSAISNNVAKIQFLPEPPEIAKAPTADSPSCSYDEIENFTLYFKRQLYSHEKLEVNLLKKFQDGSYVPIDDNVDITSLIRVSDTEYKYFWDSTDEELTGGDYRMIVSGFDKSNNSPFCEQYIYNFTIAIPPPVIFDSATNEQNETCYGANDGKIKIKASGGSGSYKYSLNNGTFSSVFNGEIIVTKAPGTYIIKIKDSNDCEVRNTTGNEVTKTVTINAKSRITHIVGGVTNTSDIGQSDGAITISSVSGGTPTSNNYSYKILNASNGQIKSGTISATGGTISGLPAGTHKIVYTDSNNCTQQYTLTPIVNPVPLNFAVSSQKPDCNGGYGKIIVSNISGGYPNYKITISKTGGGYSKVLNNIATSTTNSIDDVLAGSYKVTVKDTRLNAVLEKTINVDEQSQVVISNISNTPIGCFEGTSRVTITAQGGKSNDYQYAVYKATNIQWQDSNVFNLTANNTSGYRFIVRDKNITDCKSSISNVLKITEPTEIELGDPIVTHNNIFGGSQGIIDLPISGGTPNTATPSYVVTWTRQGDTSFSKTGSRITGLRAGFYTATIKDKNNCSITSNTIEVEENPEFKIVSLDIDTDVVCYGDLGSLSVTLDGGAGEDEYSYQWYKDGQIINGKTSSTLVDVAFAEYKVIVSDGYVTLEDSKRLNNPSQVKLTLEKTDITCFNAEDGKIKLNSNGGSSVYFYSIDDKTTYFNVNTLTDNTIVDLTEGDYEVWLKDDKGCEIDTSVKVTIDSPTEIKITFFNIINNDVAGSEEGSISINASGGEGVLYYSWTKDGDTNFSLTGKEIIELQAGFYTVVIEDDNQCTVTEEYEVKEPLPLEVTIEQTNEILCFNEVTGSLLAKVTGGYPIESTVLDFDYKWYLLEGTVETLLNTDVKLNEISGLKSGNYKVVVNDAKGTTRSSLIFELKEPNELKVEFSSKEEVSCYGGNDGSILIDVEGGTKAYTFKWTKTDDIDFNKTTEDIDELFEGTYNVEIEDANGCKASLLSIEITQPSEALSIDTFSITNLTGFEEGDGSIIVEAKGGTPDYSYEWRIKDETDIIGEENEIKDLQIGDYEVTIIDVKGCEIIESYSLTQPDLLEITSITQSKEILCFGDKGITLSSEVEGGVKPYTYNWYVKGSTVSIGDIDILENVGAAEYILEVTDANQIKAIKEYEIVQPLNLEITSLDVKNVSCFNGIDGSILIEPIGGIAPYTYSWKHTTETVNNLTELSSGFYTVTIRDKNLCSIEKEIEITQPEKGLTVINELKENVTGFGLSNGSVNLEIEGGASPYSYEWAYEGNILTAETTNNISDKITGTYTLKVTDSKLCELNLTYIIEEPLELLATVSETAILCNGEEGKLTSEVEGGVLPYQYFWYNTSGDIVGSEESIGIVSGVYSFEVVDANNNRKKIEGINLDEPLALEIASLDVKNVSCFNGEDGSILIKGTGGIAPYTYSWKHTIEATNNLTGLSSGLYTVTIRDKNLCFIEEVIEITQPEKELTVVNDVKENVTGFGLSNGSVNLEIEGGASPYSYEWAYEGNILTAETTNNISDKITGTYTLKVTDSKLCELNLTYIIEEPLELLATVSETAILCNGEEGKLTSEVEGGVLPYQYFWYNISGDLVSSETDLTIVSGVYSLEVVDANNNRKRIDDINLGEPLLLEFDSIEIKPVTCYNGSDGSIEINVKGGFGNQDNYIYSWSHGVNGKKLENLPTGNYSVTITDENGCSLEKDNIIVAEPVTYDIIETKLVRPTVEDGSDGSIQVSITGGVSPYNYLWTNENNDVVSNITTSDNENSISSLEQGTYTITITDAISCLIEETYNLANPGELLVSVEQLQEITCFNGSNAILNVITVGGVGGNNFKWYNVNDDTTVLSTRQQLTNVPAGKYYVVVDNAEDIEEKSSVFEVTQPTEVKLEANTNNLSCFQSGDGSINFNATGGSGDYEYRFRLSTDNYSNWIAFEDEIINLTSLQAGDYNIQLRGIVGDDYCFATDYSDADNEFTFTISQPNVLEIVSDEIIEPTGYQLSNGSITIQVNGGTAPYTYEWTDSAGLSLSNNNALIENLTAGLYSVEITDINGCKVEKDYVLDEPLKLEVDLVLNSVISCKGEEDGSIEAKVSGGVSEYIYNWFKEGSTTVIGSESIISNIQAGNYYVVIVDANNNTVTSEVYSLSEPEVLELELFSDYVLCGIANDWTITSNVKGGTAPYSYLWNTGEYTDTLTEVTAGTYKLTVVDIRGCQQTVNITLESPDFLEITSEEIIEPTGYELSNGSIKVEVTGGTPGYVYEWKNSNGIVLTHNNTLIENLAAGSYTLEVTDTKGCKTSNIYVLDQPLKLEVAVTLSSIISCQGEADGAIEANVSGGVLEYTYDWFKEGSSVSIGSEKTLTNITVGNYYVVIVDSKNNTVTSEFYSLLEPEILELELFSDYELCGIGKDWTITSNVTGGTAPYSYLWDSGEYTDSLNELISGTYSLTVVDARGCTETTSINLVAPDTLKVNDFTIKNPTCYEGDDGEIAINVVGGTPPYEYKWNNDLITKDVNGLKSGTYEVIITDSKGCSTFSTFDIINPEEIKVDLGEDITLCKDQTYFIDATIDEGIAYQWSSSNGFTSSDAAIELIEAGIYKVEVTTNLGCLVTDTIEIKISDKDIDSEFIISSVAYTNESIVMINISDFDFDEVTWFFPVNASVIYQGDDYAEILIEEEGDYEITLKTRLGDCEKIRTKSVLVLEKEFNDDTTGDDVNKQMLEDVNLYPNPSSGGVFNLDIELKEEATVNVKIYKLNSTIIHYQNYYDKDMYELDYSFNLPTGVYFVLVETKEDRILKKLIIQ